VKVAKQAKCDSADALGSGFHAFKVMIARASPWMIGDRHLRKPMSEGAQRRMEHDH
jgi:hypothetical protein